jgi:diguanylate cyclase (GGDEF)-like protein
MLLLYSRLTKQEILEKIATKDSLTDLYNRRKFHEAIELQLKKVSKGALIILDIDHFKRINDQYGHNVGDVVLKLLARKLLSNIRENDIVARWGGEEFLIFLSGSDIINATKIAERIRLAVSETDFTIKDQVTISLGVAMIQNYDQINDAIKAADDALYKAKSTGRNKVEVNIST